MFLKKGFEEEYKKRHNDIWPELTSLIEDSGICDYSIFWDKDTNILYAIQKLKTKVNSQDLSENPIVQKWWAYMADIMETNADNSPVTVPLEIIFHLD
jgi:L-rhamnose mutarotase